MTPFMRILEVRGSNLRLECSEVACDFTQSLLANVGIVPQFCRRLSKLETVILSSLVVTNASEETVTSIFRIYTLKIVSLDSCETSVTIYLTIHVSNLQQRS